MNKQTIIDLLTNEHNSFINYINSLTHGEYSYSAGQKWSAGQQLEHIVLCIKPLVQVFGIDKIAIEKTFGKTDRKGRTYEELYNEYKIKLSEGGKAPERFVPAAVLPEQRAASCELLAGEVKELCEKIETFSDEELDTLLIPHPLLKSLTLREMLYNAIHHVQHHHIQAQENLK